VNRRNNSPYCKLV